MTGVTRKRLATHKGRRGGDSEHFAMLPDEVLTSDACRTLPHPPFRVLVALAAQYWGRHNGSLTITRSTASKYGIGDTHPLRDGLRELEARGLIICTRPGTRSAPTSLSPTTRFTSA